MSFSFVSTFVALPLLILVSIPLVIFACITIPLALLILLFRLFLLYIDLCQYVVKTRFGTSDRTSTSPSPSTPALFDFPAPSLPSTSSTTTRRRSSLGPHNHHHHHTHTHRHRPTPPGSTNANSPPTPHLLNLISGDEARDFEGLGGWRNAPNAKPYLAVSGTVSPNSISNDNTNTNTTGPSPNDPRTHPPTPSAPTTEKIQMLTMMTTTNALGSQSTAAWNSPPSRFSAAPPQQTTSIPSLGNTASRRPPSRLRY
ncbi:hypothetical protein BO70DRAFT_32484 [Aspergillus heteromorphus CBS 117.55]|uniref:Uncharacterized protein n=1 Tax=Aspergillus heteromorphus CBS 117.55 TaxID=1448321 RepID=A0A317WFC7_9EURO|nr:uncharacterized protein BO70DRAFT_32484 [Aspergillus heteromorphus CBS 117.55]PWY82950.1 hypothetical protein BO70DRAFT_32484 [Aspergillus heteromorphus CBS 117.55]